jgi:acetyl-CoA carboxylase carboxyl transferase subunit beta|uniref:Acetyl-coenzyme A carboxylase carboxyl transferase subunit beta n=1 Tax=Thorea hispida TaxID=202687 RepID=A0A1C9CAJ4_9FLOR|nr:acetyl-CoA carboxylase beta subunit [Thorea hispida]AOM65412.1 acetyl-CoA carboxylase beta subunit [Thorea hispida]ARX95782.1 acetyl-CoA carboxylase carboxytransferase beta subunit [Thorea hispida]UNJ79203.1 acetyl-CoA carboxylase beta subunit [Thorea hispida]
MSVSEWLLEKRNLKFRFNHNQLQSRIPEGLWVKCSVCGLLMYYKVLSRNAKVCPQCDHHFPTTSQERILQILDHQSWEPINYTLVSNDPLGFIDQKLYGKRLQDMKNATGLQDAVQTGLGLINNMPIAIGFMDFRFMGGSMGSVVGEKLTRMIEIATIKRIPVIIVCASGGARMQEGLLSLMQMAKVSSALQKHSACKLLYISVLTSPTTGGVTASFAMLGNIIIAEPRALIAFAGRRVIEQTIKEDLPSNFQTSEYLFEHGFIDLIVSRKHLRDKLNQILCLHL